MVITPAIVAGGYDRRLWSLSRTDHLKHFWGLETDNIKLQRLVVRLLDFKSLQLIIMKRGVRILCDSTSPYLCFIATRRQTGTNRGR